MNLSVSDKRDLTNVISTITQPLRAQAEQDKQLPALNLMHLLMCDLPGDDYEFIKAIRREFYRDILFSMMLTDVKKNGSNQPILVECAPRENWRNSEYYDGIYLVFCRRSVEIQGEE